MVVELVTLAEFTSHIRNNDMLVFDFHASWCPPCKAIDPIFRKLAVENPTVVFAKIDVDLSPEISKFAKIKCMPTYLFYRDEELVNTLEGADEEELKRLVKEFVTAK